MHFVLAIFKNESLLLVLLRHPSKPFLLAHPRIQPIRVFSSLGFKPLRVDIYDLQQFISFELVLLTELDLDLLLLVDDFCQLQIFSL